MKKIYFVFIFLFLSVGLYASENFPVGKALDNIETVRIIVDFNVSSPEMIILRLVLLEKTLNEIEMLGKKYDVVVAIRGGAVDYMTTTDKYIRSDFRDALIKIRSMISSIRSRGVSFELCSIAASLRGVEPKDIIEGITVVKNGYLSIIGYQLKGYALLPMD